MANTIPFFFFFFFWGGGVILRKRHFVQKAMCFIQKDNGNIIHDSNSITKEVKTFYENLFALRENEVVHATIENINIPTLSQEDSDNLEGPNSIQEALSALKQIKIDKVQDQMVIQSSFSNSFSQI